MAYALQCSSSIKHHLLPAETFQTRVVCSDRYAAQLAAEKHNVAQHAHRSLLHFPCEVHGSTASQSKALLLIGPAIYGMIRLACSLRMGGWMRILRQELTAEVESTFGCSGRAVSCRCIGMAPSCIVSFSGEGTHEH